MWLAIIIAVLVVIGAVLLFTNTNKTPSIGNNNPGTSTNTGTGGKTYNVDIQNLAFSPAGLTIKSGDTITWTNKDAVAHQIISDSGNEISSPSLSQGTPYSHKFTTPGTYRYHCSIHPSMTGTVVVQ